jgi:hypothetical protein
MVGMSPSRSPFLLAPSRTRTRALLVVLLSVALTFSVVTSASARSLDSACPTSLQRASFHDVAAASTHADAIGCMASWGVARGQADGTYRPNSEVTRAQVATFLYRLLEIADVAPAAGTVRFTDVPGGHSHARAVNALAAAGVIRGLTETTFGPERPVSRGQLASLLVRAHELLFATLLATGETTLKDIAGDTHEPAIRKLLPLGIVAGHADGTYRPGTSVSREQMASFLARYADLLVGENRATVPQAPRPELVSDDPESRMASPFGGRRHFGVATPSNAWDDRELEHVTAVTGQRPSVILHYLGFGDELQPQQLRNVATWGAMPLLTWEPFDWRATHPTTQPEYALRHIIEGRFDDHLTRTARTLQAFGEPVLLRFAHEMNGDWYPWSEQVNGNRPGEYVAAWRHVHTLFDRLGVDNVHWVWSPNVEYPGSAPLAGLYPGRDLVDVIALDGYNWGSAARSGWQSPAQVFDPTLAAVRSLAPGVPIMIGETASNEHGGSKASWNTELFTWLERNPDIEAVVWFNLKKEADWRVDSSTSSATTFADGVGRWLRG